MDITNNSVSSSNVQQQSEQQNTLGGTLFGGVGVGGGFGNSQVNISLHNDHAHRVLVGNVVFISTQYAENG